METRYHLLIGEGDLPIWRGMRLVNGRYATSFNDRHQRTGHVFDGRYRDVPIESEAHLLSAIRYVALNPVEVAACESPHEWRWSTYGQLVGLERGWSFVSTAWTLSLFAPQREAAIRHVREFVESVPGT